MSIQERSRPLNQEVGRCREPYGFRKSLEALNDAIPLPTYASTVTELKKSGLQLVGSCPIPDHEDSSPSFTVYQESGRWHCFGCSRGGDLLDLFMAVEDWPEDAYGPALAAMAQRFGVELPQRPARWHDWQDEKARRRKTIRETLTRSYQRRFFRVYGTYLEDIGDPQEREDEARRFFEDLRTIAVVAAENRMSR